MVLLSGMFLVCEKFNMLVESRYEYVIFFFFYKFVDLNEKYKFE